MKNFDYLLQIPPLRDLYNFCNAAEETMHTDYDNCAGNCRKALERIVRDIYKLKHVEASDRTSLYELTTGKPFTELVGDDGRIMMAVHYVRKVGNIAVHQGGVKQSEAFFSLQNLYNLVGGILLRLGVLKTLAPFNKELVPKQTTPYIQPTSGSEKNPDDLSGVVPQENIKKPLQVSIPSDNISEAETRRQFIDLMLREAGWEVLTKENVAFASKAGIEIEVDGMPNGKGKGYCDYVLFGKDCRPLAIIEAKKTTVDPNVGKHQAMLYADCLERQYGVRPVIYYTNGFHTYIIDGLGYPPRQVLGFHTLNDLELMMSRRTRQPLKDLGIKDEITNRDYQKMAIRAVCDHLNDMHRHGLIVMATGTGKTRVAISLSDVLLRSKWVKNILFLADRTALVKQACENFSNLLPEYPTCILTDAKEEDKNARLMFSTYQTMINYIDSEDKEFSIGRFDLIILDEAHRSIFGKYTAIFDYFDAFLVGLTATPRDEVDRSTYELFHLDSGEPNFVYSQKEAIAEGHLVDYNPISRTTKRLREGILLDSLSEEEKEQLDRVWLDEKARAEEDLGAEVDIAPHDIERKELFEYIYNTKTVDIVLQELMRVGLKINNGDKLGKTIIFAYDKTHAQLIVDRFYELYPSFDPNFCQRVDYSVKYAQNIIDNFKLRDKMPQLVVSVDMLDTGIDVPDILNLVFFKPIYSRIKYIQMVGRGTRLCKGIFADGSDKKEFYIFDWCENFEYFKQNTNGREPLQSLSMTERLFQLKVDISTLLQHQNYQSDVFAASLCTRLKEELHAQVCGLNELHASVRKVWETVHKFKNKAKWTYVSPLEALELKRLIAPLIIQDQDETSALSFDALMMNIELSLLLPEVTATKSKNKVTSIAKRLLGKASLPVVQEHIDTIKEISNVNFWGSPSLQRLEQVREELRDIIKNALRSKREPIIITVDDTMEEKEGEKPVIMTDYHTRILDYLNEHHDNETIKKIYRLEKLTNADIMELERICWKELGTKEEYEAYIQKGQKICGDKVAAFIRSMIGIDIQIAKERFSQFLSDNVLNALQEEYLNQIIGYVCENGDIKPESLMTDDHLKELNWSTVFGPKMVSIGKYVTELHNLIA